MNVSYQKIQKVGYTSIFQNLLTTLIKCLLAYNFLCWFASFSKNGVTSASLISDGNLPNFNDLLNSWCKIGVKMLKLTLSIFAWICEFGEDLEESISMCYVTEVESIVFIFIMGFNWVNLIRWFLNFSLAHKIGPSILLVYTK